MNKKDIAMLKKGFKIDDIKLRIGETLNSYCKMEGKKIIFAEKSYFDSMDEETQELFIVNFKKLLTGALGTKLFDLEFVSEDEGKKQQQFIYSIVNGENFEAKAKELTQKILDEVVYETDILVSCIKADYYISTKNKKNEEDAGEDDTATAFTFIMCSINKIEPAKKTLKFDCQEQEFTTESALNLTINLNNPIEGFMYPTLNTGYSDVNKVLYYSSKGNQINEVMVNEVLKLSTTLTAKQEKELFGEMLKSTLGEKVKPELISDIYEGIATYALENEASTINTDEIETILINAGVENASQIKSVVADVLGKENADLNVYSVIPGNGKSVKINSSKIDIALNPAVLKSVKQVNKNGKKCLIIELDDSVNLEGFELETEK
jgi:hypothetical protein